MVDIALDEDFVLISDGDDFAEADSDTTDADLICRLKKGQLRYAPWLGFGIEERLLAVSNETRFVRELKVELENDGFVNPEVDVSEGFENLKIFL